MKTRSQLRFNHIVRGLIVSICMLLHICLPISAFAEPEIHDENETLIILDEHDLPPDVGIEQMELIRVSDVPVPDGPIYTIEDLNASRMKSRMINAAPGGKS